LSPGNSKVSIGENTSLQRRLRKESSLPKEVRGWIDLHPTDSGAFKMVNPNKDTKITKQWQGTSCIKTSTIKKQTLVEISGGMIRLKSSEKIPSTVSVKKWWCEIYEYALRSKGYLARPVIRTILS